MNERSHLLKVCRTKRRKEMKHSESNDFDLEDDADIRDLMKLYLESEAMRSSAAAMVQRQWR